MPSLFSSQDPSKALSGHYGEHIDSFGTPVDRELRKFERLHNGSDKYSSEGLVNHATANKNTESISRDVPLDDIVVQKEVDVRIDPGHRHEQDRTGTL